MPNVTYQEPSDAQLLEGKVRFRVESAESKYSTTGNEMIVFDLDLADPKTNNNGVARYEQLVFTKKAEWKINQFLAAVGHAPNPGDDVDLNAQNIVGLCGWCEVGKKLTGKGATVNEVTRYVFTKGQESANGLLRQQSAAAPAQALAGPQSPVDADDDLPF